MVFGARLEISQAEVVGLGPLVQRVSGALEVGIKSCCAVCGLLWISGTPWTHPASACFQGSELSVQWCWQGAQNVPTFSSLGQLAFGQGP